MRIFELFLVGTAWLSSVRVVKCNIKLLNERNLYYKCHINFLLKILVFLDTRLMRLGIIYTTIKRIFTHIVEYLFILKLGENCF